MARQTDFECFVAWQTECFVATRNKKQRLTDALWSNAGIKQLGSTRSRKISSHSLQSDAKLVEEDGTTTFEDAESVTMLSDETQESPVERDQEVEDEHLCDSLPWIKVSRDWDECPFALCRDWPQNYTGTGSRLQSLQLCSALNRHKNRLGLNSFINESIPTYNNNIYLSVKQVNLLRHSKLQD